MFLTMINWSDLICLFHFSPPDKTQLRDQDQHLRSCQASQEPEFRGYKKKLPLAKGLQKPPCARQRPTPGMGTIGGTEPPWKQKREKNLVLEAIFFPFNLPLKKSTSVHFWCPIQDIVVLSDKNPPHTKHSAACQKNVFHQSQETSCSCGLASILFLCSHVTTLGPDSVRCLHSRGL